MGTWVNEMPPKTIREFFADEHASIKVLGQLLAERASVGDDWSKQELVNLTELFSDSFDRTGHLGNLVDSISLIEIMEQLALSSNKQLLRRLQTVMAAGIDEFTSFYKDIELEPSFFIKTLKRRQSNLFDRVCDKSTANLPKPSSIVKKNVSKGKTVCGDAR